MHLGMIFVLSGFFLGAAGAWAISRLAPRLGLIDEPESRSSHARPTPRGGGIGIWLVVALGGGTGLLSPVPALAGWLVGMVSLWDDLRPLSAWLRLASQLGLAAVALVFVWQDPSPAIMFWLVPGVLFVAGTANFFNFMDGINGIAACSGLVAFTLLALFAALSGADAGMMWFCGAMAAACAGFLPFNVPKARVFMGDVGSVTLGFLFALCTISLAGSWPDFVCMAFFLFPFYADTLTTLFVRWRDGERLSQAHRRHLYQLLANEYGLPHWLVCLVYAIVQCVCGFLMLSAWRTGPFFQLLCVAAAALLFLAAAWPLRRAVEVGREV
jgi:Fuc2NAc and GlcNAc transferase